MTTFVKYLEIMERSRSLKRQLSQELEQDEVRTFRHRVGSPVASPPGNWAHFGSPVEHSFSKSPGLGHGSPYASTSTKIASTGKDPGRAANQIFANSGSTQGAVFQHSMSFPEQKVNASPRPISTFSESSSSSSSIGTLSGPQFLWGSPTPYSEHSNTSAWSSSSLGLPFASGRQRQSFPFTNHHSSFLSSEPYHHIGSNLPHPAFLLIGILTTSQSHLTLLS